MRSAGRSRAVARRLLLPLVIGGFLTATMTTATIARPVAHTAGKVIAVVKSASGGHLTVVRKAGGARQSLTKGGSIRYGDLVLAGPGAHAVVVITVPSADTGKNDLIDVKPTGGATVKLEVERTASRTIQVTLSA